MSIPLIILLNIVMGVNSREIQDDLPPMKGGSREVTQVYNSFSRLFKIVRFSNTAFFSGNTLLAHKFLSDACCLFENVKDSKALAIASNNLGNAYMSLYKDKATNGRCYKIDGRCVRPAAEASYDKAVEIGLQDYQLSLTADVENSVRAEYAQQLANRYFNRGMYFLLMESDPCSPEDAYERGCEDIKKARVLDNDVRDYWLQTRQIHANSRWYFERLVRRGCGVIQFTRQGRDDTGEADPYDPNEILFEADSLLASVGQDVKAPLLQDVSRAGRLQELEEIAIRCQLALGNVHEAARYASRMLMEDEYLLETAFEAAATAIVQSMRIRGVWRPNVVEMARAQLRAMSKSCRSAVSIPIGKNVIFCIDEGMTNADGRKSAIYGNILSLFDHQCYEHDYVSCVVYGDGVVNEEESFGLVLKREIDMEDTGFLLDPERPRVSTEDAPRKSRANNLNVALERALHFLKNPPNDESRRNDSAIVMATDAAVWPNHGPIVRRLEEINNRKEVDRVRAAKVDLLVVGVDASSAVVDAFQTVCHEKDSAYVDSGGDLDSMNTAFQDLAVKLVGPSSVRGITVEKF